MNDPAVITAAFRILIGFHAILQVIVAFLMMIAAFLGLLTLTLIGIGLISGLYKGGVWLQAHAPRAAWLFRPGHAHAHLKSKHATHA